jgi:hypothetical protein
MITYNNTLAAGYNWLGNYLQTLEVNDKFSIQNIGMLHGKLPVTLYWSAKRGRYLDPKTGDVISDKFTTVDPISWVYGLSDLIKSAIDEYFLRESEIEIHVNRRLFEKLGLIMGYSSAIYGAKVIEDLKCELNEVIIRTDHEVRIVVQDLIDNPIIAKQSVVGEFIPKLDKLFGISKVTESEDIAELLMCQAANRLIVRPVEKIMKSVFDKELDEASKAVAISDKDAEFVENIIVTKCDFEYKKSICERIADWVYRLLGCDKQDRANVLDDKDYFIPVRPSIDGLYHRCDLPE